MTENTYAHHPADLVAQMPQAECALYLNPIYRLDYRQIREYQRHHSFTPSLRGLIINAHVTGAAEENKIRYFSSDLSHAAAAAIGFPDFASRLGVELRLKERAPKPAFTLSAGDFADLGKKAVKDFERRKDELQSKIPMIEQERATLSYPDGPELNRRLELGGFPFRVAYTDGIMSKKEFVLGLNLETPVIPYSYKTQHDHDFGDHLILGYSLFSEKIWQALRQMARFELALNAHLGVSVNTYDDTYIHPYISNHIKARDRILHFSDLLYLSGIVADGVSAQLRRRILGFDQSPFVGFSKRMGEIFSDFRLIFLNGNGNMNISISDIYGEVFTELAAKVRSGEITEKLSGPLAEHFPINIEEFLAYLEKAIEFIQAYPDRDKPLLDPDFFNDENMEQIEAGMRARLRGEDVRY